MPQQTLKRLKGLALLISCIFIAGLAASAQAGDLPEVSLTLLHTNDLHSRYRADTGPPGLGGIARIKTLADQLRGQVQNSVMIDGGDWSEGAIYYNLGAGTESLKMMNAMGYDVALIGNHDWLNGPDQILKSINEAQPSLSLIAGNFDLAHYHQAAQFKHWIQPYVIREIGGLKVAFIGVATYEFVFDSFISPIKILNPYTYLRELSSHLKGQVDAIVAVSHNSLATNTKLLRAAPDVDLIIGAHDHIKVSKPIVVERPGHHAGWLVEAKCWGQYLGRVDVKIHPRSLAEKAGKSSVELLNYQLYQIDATIPENAEIASRVKTLEDLIAKQYGPIFDDEVAENELHFFRRGSENRMGNLTTDAYLAATGADFAMDQSNFIYGELQPGTIHSVDVFNSDPAVYSPVTGKTWTVQTFDMQGKTLRWLLNLLFADQALAQFGVLSVSGMSISYDPILRSTPIAPPIQIPQPKLEPEPFGGGILRDVEIQGHLLDPAKTYRVAAGGGIIASLKFLDSLLPNALPTFRPRDTGLESWRVIADHLHANSPITAEKFPVGIRIRSMDPDLAVYEEDVTLEPKQWTDNSVTGHLKVRIRNIGLTPSHPGIGVRALGDQNGSDTSQDPAFKDLGAILTLPSLAPLESTTLEWDVTIPGSLGYYPVDIVIGANPGEVNLGNNEVRRWFKRP